MVQLAYIIASIFSIVLGAYTIVLLHQLRNKYNNDYLSSFFYYQILLVIFGVYGILGSLLIREILPKFGLPFYGIEAISHFIPFFGLPFLVSAWYMLIKMVVDFLKRKLPQIVAIVYFVLTTTLFLLLGFYLIGLSDIEIERWSIIRNKIYFGFATCGLVVESSISIIILLKALVTKNKLFRQLLLHVVGVLFTVAMIKGVSLYFHKMHFTFGIYFLVLYFGGLLPIVILIRRYLYTTTITEPAVVSQKTILFEKFNITPREKDIIEEICKGKTNKEIAETLFITLQTVKDHTHNIYQKAEVKNRVQLAQLFSAE